MATESMLTTIDNPHDPFTEYPAWFAWDAAAGYHTSEFLARIAFTSDNLSDADEQLFVELAIDEIVKENVFGVHRKVTREIEDSNSESS